MLKRIKNGTSAYPRRRRPGCSGRPATYSPAIAGCVCDENAVHCRINSRGLLQDQEARSSGVNLISGDNLQPANIDPSLVIRRFHGEPQQHERNGNTGGAAKASAVCVSRLKRQVVGFGVFESAVAAKVFPYVITGFTMEGSIWRELQDLID